LQRSKQNWQRAKVIRRTVIGLIALSVSSAAQSNYFTYQQWLAMPEPGRVAYLAGAYDSLLTFAEDEQVTSHYSRCLNMAQMTNFQLAANVLSFAKDRPALQTGSVQGALINYLIAACGKLPTK